jgi:2-polyprenyl-3-methyl-5-hydroxy-6-metoxy-1,4-benzoquinol methylase
MINLMINNIKDAFLKNYVVYEVVQWVFAAKVLRTYLAENFLNSEAVYSILDVGCGTSLISNEIHAEKKYTGFDINSGYILSGKGRKNNILWIGGVNSLHATRPAFDRIILIGLLHHLKSEDCSKLLHVLKHLLVPSGEIITFDPCRVQGAGWLSSKVVDLDRGRYVRSIEQYTQLFSGLNLNIEKSIISNPRFGAYKYALLRVRHSQTRSD